jgi:hypothetical protein
VQAGSTLRVWVSTILLLLLLLRRVVLRWLATCVLQLATVMRMRVLTSTIDSGVIITIVVLL